MKTEVGFEVLRFRGFEVLMVVSSGMWCSVGLVRTDVLENRVASIFTVKRIRARNNVNSLLVTANVASS
jgi:hypothetical protein